MAGSFLGQVFERGCHQREVVGGGGGGGRGGGVMVRQLTPWRFEDEQSAIKVCCISHRRFTDA